MILPNGRSAARCAIIVHSAELAKRTTRVEAHVVLERDMRVGIVGSLERQPIRRPVLPPVVIQLKSVVEPMLLPIEETSPRVP